MDTSSRGPGDEVDWTDVSQRVVTMINNLYAQHLEDDPFGSARHALWACEDGWAVGYTTERVTGGPHHGKFAVLAYKPVGPGARGGRGTAREWERVYYRGFSTRKGAKARAVAVFGRHSPPWSRRGLPATVGASAGSQVAL